MIHVFYLDLIFALFLSACIPVEVSSYPSEDTSSNNQDEFEQSFTSNKTALLITAITSIAFLSAVVVAIFKCTDCYNSEVSSENHPACGNSKEYKWGGAEGYSSANPSNPNSGFTETVELTPQQSLPYTLIPTGAPTAGGFQGFTAPGQAAPQSPAGFGNEGSGRFSYGSSRHHNPMEEQEPPPAYEAAARSGSFYGNR